jgi:hypothetical protein
MDNKKVNEEHKRLLDLLDRAEVPQQQRDVLAPVIDNMAWQRVKLDETRKEMQHASVVCEYNNGGGQAGTRENPIFKAYINLWRAYMVGLDKFTSYLPKELQEEAAGDSVDILAQVRSMKKGNA